MHRETFETIMQEIEALLDMAKRAEEQGDTAGHRSYVQEARWHNERLNAMLKEDEER